MIIVGWSATVTGQSLVLYSRLHLIDCDRRHLRVVLAIIITNGVIFHSLTAALGFGANSTSNPAPFYKPYSITKKVQVTVFFVQEFGISLLYIWATICFFHNSALHAASARAKLLWHLIGVNVVVICMDITILGLEFANLYKAQTAYKAMSYSIKLKLEFSILNQLVNITREHSARPPLDVNAGMREADGWDSLQGPSHHSTTSNTVTSGHIEERRPAWDTSERSGLYMATCFACSGGRKKGRCACGSSGGIMRTTEVSISRDDEEEGPSEGARQSD